MAARMRLVDTDVDTDEVPVGDDVNHWPESNPSSSPSSDSTRRSSSINPKEPTSTSVIGGRTTQVDDRPILTTPKEGARRAGRRH